MPVRVEALFRRRWVTCTVQVVDGVTVAVCPAGDVGPGVPLLVWWRGTLGNHMEALLLVGKLRRRYANVTIREERSRRAGKKKGKV